MNTKDAAKALTDAKAAAAKAIVAMNQVLSQRDTMDNIREAHLTKAVNAFNDWRKAIAYYKAVRKRENAIHKS